MSRCSFFHVLLVAGLTLAVGSCTAISIEPACPNELRVGESGPVRSNVRNPGAAASYMWEVFPADAGVFANENAADTTFEAQQAGEAIIRLTASDGLYQVVSQCSTLVAGTVGVGVGVEVGPDPAVVGEPASLTCTSIGTVEATLFAIVLLEGGPLDLNIDEPGIATFTPTQIGDLTFRCVGGSDDGRQSEPAFITVAVVTAPVDNGIDNGDGENGNANVNDNANDNGADNANTNGGRRPPRPGN